MRLSLSRVDQHTFSNDLDMAVVALLVNEILVLPSAKSRILSLCDDLADRLTLGIYPVRACANYFFTAYELWLRAFFGLED